MVDTSSGPVVARAWRRRLVVSVSVLLALLLPLLVQDFSVFQLTLVLIYAIAILGLNLLTGINGQFSLGHSAFYAVGAYTTAILVSNYEVNAYLTLPVSALLGFVAGFLFGFPALRLSGMYLALATFALSVATPQLLKYTHFEALTGGVQGIDLFKPDVPFDLPLSLDQWWYYVCLGILLVLMWMVGNLIHSRTGRALMAIRDNPIAASTMGVNAPVYKTVCFGLSAAITAIAGALSAIVVEYVAPDSFTFILSVYFLIGMVIGGVGWVPGAIIGGAFVLYVPNLAEQVSTGLAGVLFGVCILLVIYVMPSGASGLLRWLGAWARRARRPPADRS
ncbi:MAG: branched-chain amino acid ABC transporter permease [Gammaproteobacteria bacterium]|nr:branched-chain amino acid ABC transporter permease [Gammaproteobacteria bacterium]